MCVSVNFISKKPLKHTEKEIKIIWREEKKIKENKKQINT